MNYISTREAAEQWGVSLRHVQRLLHANRIPGARKYGVSWLIPASAGKPTDKRPGERAGARVRKSAKKELPTELGGALFPLLYIHGGDLTAAYHRCQNEEERALLDAGLAYFRGDAAKARALAAALLNTAKRPQTKLGAPSYGHSPPCIWATRRNGKTPWRK